MSKREYTYKGGKRPSMRKKGELAILKSQYKQSQKELRKQEQSIIKKINALCDEIEAAMNGRVLPKVGNSTTNVD